MDQKTFSNSLPSGGFQNRMRENFRSDQNIWEFKTAVDKIRQPPQGHSVDRKVGASSGVRRGYPRTGKELHEKLSDWSTDGLLNSISSPVDEGRDHRSREIRKEATPKFPFRIVDKRPNSVSSSSSIDNDEFGAIVDSALHAECNSAVKAVTAMPAAVDTSYTAFQEIVSCCVLEAPFPESMSALFIVCSFVISSSLPTRTVDAG